MTVGMVVGAGSGGGGPEAAGPVDGEEEVVARLQGQVRGADLDRRSRTVAAGQGVS
ncbi:hypothetical protein [Streptacidiphilus sp. EB103A]|uniref:hypothetical protein n=1 Tax=Streptacidiphilus sp. EB103A TaxID=3156275 RepID=UPI00351459B1